MNCISRNIYMYILKRKLSLTHTNKQTTTTTTTTACLTVLKTIITQKKGEYVFYDFSLLIRCRSSIIKTIGKEANLIKEYYFWILSMLILYWVCVE